MESLKVDKIKWEDFDDDNIFIITVDGVHCRIYEPQIDPGSKWYSHKFHAAGVAYEVAIAIRSNL